MASISYQVTWTRNKSFKQINTCMFQCFHISGKQMEEIRYFSPKFAPDKSIYHSKTIKMPTCQSECQSIPKFTNFLIINQGTPIIRTIFT